MDRNVLLIVASGKSSRFGGFPKAFCHIGDRTVAGNTVLRSKRIFEKAYLVVNRDIYDRYADEVKDCEIFSIVTGQGDAHSILKALDYIKGKEGELKTIVICWGDAVFVDETPFEQLIAGAGDADVAVACSMDDKPYAWFETDADGRILKSHFAMKEGFVEKGIHDQSLFLLDFQLALRYLNEYRESLGIPYDNDEAYADKNEMKLLDSFEYLYKSGYGYARCVNVTPGKVLSFNTEDELRMIRDRIEQKEG